MISELDVVEAVKAFCNSKPGGEPSEWMDALVKAPDGAKMRMILAFWFSKNQEKLDDSQKDEYRKLREAYESGLTQDDLKYLSELELFPENTREHYKELLGKVAGGAPTGLGGNGMATGTGTEGQS